jgi:hypothetical protein
MKLIYAIIIFLVSPGNSVAQDTVITIKAGEEVSALYEHIYKYPLFSAGTVYFNDGTIARSKMNLNLLLEVMQFINDKGDTLALDDENTIKHITVGADTFFFQEGYLQLVSTYGKTELVTRQKIKFLNEKNIGAYGISTATHTIDNYNTLRAFGTYSLKLNKDLIYSKEKKFFFSKGNDGFILANKKNILRMFSSKKSLVEKYLEEQKLDFNNEEDLKNLFAYLSGF